MPMRQPTSYELDHLPWVPMTPTEPWDPSSLDSPFLEPDTAELVMVDSDIEAVDDFDLHVCRALIDNSPTLKIVHPPSILPKTPDYSLL